MRAAIRRARTKRGASGPSSNRSTTSDTISRAARRACSRTRNGKRFARNMACSASRSAWSADCVADFTLDRSPRARSARPRAASPATAEKSVSRTPSTRTCAGTNTTHVEEVHLRKRAGRDVDGSRRVREVSSERLVADAPVRRTLQCVQRLRHRLGELSRVALEILLQFDVSHPRRCGPSVVPGELDCNQLHRPIVAPRPSTPRASSLSKRLAKRRQSFTTRGPVAPVRMA